MSQPPEEPNSDAAQPTDDDVTSSTDAKASPPASSSLRPPAPPMPAAPPSWSPPAPPTPAAPAPPAPTTAASTGATSAPPTVPAWGTDQQAAPVDDDPYRNVPPPTVGGDPYGSSGPAPSTAGPYGAAYGTSPYGAPSSSSTPYGARQYAMPGYAPPGSSFGVPVRTSGKAIGSLVASLLWVCGLGSLVAVILGHLARRDIKLSGGALGGRGVATAGLVLGYLGLLTSLLLVGALAAISADVDRLFEQEVEQAAPDDEINPDQEQRQLVPARASCPDASEINAVVGEELVLGNAGRGVEDGVVDCLYVRITEEPPNLRNYVILAIQDDLTTLSVEEYFSERELDAPTPTQLGAAAGTAERFGYDEYDAPDTNVPFIDTGAANGNRSAVLSVPVSFGLDAPELFEATVDFLDGIRTPSNVI